ncbi:MAG: hypothetical protein ABSD85_01375 [Acidimicrobiales bacterium]
MIAASLSRSGRANRHRVVVLMLGAIAGAVVLAGASSASGAGALTPPPGRAPLQASMTTSSGTWVDLAMGDLAQLANTFWQVLYLEPGGSRWSLVTPPGFADNGGLVSVQVGPSLLTGFMASQQIGFSPLASSSDGGKRWAPGVITSPLAVVPDALAALPDGRVVALTGKPATAVLSDSGGLSSWQRTASGRHLETSPGGRACGVTALTALAVSPGGQLLVGTSCARTGEVGIFEQSATGWRLAGPSLPSAGSARVTSVLRLRSFDGGVSALIATSSGGHTELFGTRLAGRAGWSKPVGLALGGNAQLSASGISADGGLVVEVAGAGGLVAEVLGPGERAWTELHRLPPRTAAVCFEEGGRIDALAVDHSQLTIYRLAKSGSDWQRAQEMQVPIQYGSSG